MTGNKTYLTPNQVARILMVSPVTVRQWARRGLLNAATTPGGHRRFSPEEVERFARSRGLGGWGSGAPEYRLLVMSEDVELASRLLRTLESTGRAFRLDLVSDGFAAGLRVARSAPHAVLIDAALSGVNLPAVCDHLRGERETVNTRVVLLADGATRLRSQDLRVDGVLEGGLDARRLTRALGLEMAVQNA